MSSFKKEFFNFLETNKRERNGLAVLACLMIVGLLFYTFMNDIFKPDFSENHKNMLENYQEYKAIMAKAELEQDSVLKAQSSSASFDSIKDQKYPSKKLFNFDPNSTTPEDWKRLGFNSGQIKTIENYLNKGGKFYKPEDLAKIYTISDKQFREIEPFIQIKKQNKPKKSWQTNTKQEEKKEYTEWKDYEKKKREPLYIDINLADTTELKKLKGIGSWFAKNIVKHREELGGFHSIAQLQEIYNFTPDKLSQIQDEIHLGNSPLNKININTCDAEQLVKHPYLGWSEANSIVKYREQHGDYKTIEDIQKSHLISEELCQKIKPYLTLK